MLFRLGLRGKTACRLLERFNAVGLKKEETRLACAFYQTNCSQIFGRGAESRHLFYSLPALRHVLAAPGAVRPAGIRIIHSAAFTQGPALSDSELQELGVAPKKSVIFDTNLKRLHVSHPLEPLFNLIERWCYWRWLAGWAPCHIFYKSCMILSHGQLKDGAAYTCLLDSEGQCLLRCRKKSCGCTVTHMLIIRIPCTCTS